MPLLQVEDLRVQFHTDDGVVRAVDGASFNLEPGEALGIVGESGSGKSVTNLAILGLIPQPPGKIDSGRALFHGRDLLKMSQKELQTVRGHKIAMIFQDPMTSLNPFLTVAEQLTEVTRLHLKYTAKRALDHAVTMLERVGIPAAARRVHDYPHQFSGGMRQRVMVAMALSCKPEIIIADEPTTALDVTIQAQILDLMRQLQREEGTAIILITHSLGVVANLCGRVSVMYAGKFVEEAPVDRLFARPRHPYTLGLLQSIPRLDEKRGDRLHPIQGQPPDMIRLPSGCAFHPRCPFKVDKCVEEVPPLFTSPEGTRYACFVDVTAVREEAAAK
ncbi:MAG: ABC transporter ATP-binding protein [Planctomycetia bacterium]|nr:ABC transporter ATP-binding protein [Planctomycetia bacterium]